MKQTENRIGAFEAKTHFSQVLNRVERGETIDITRRGHTVARIVPVEQSDREQAKSALKRMKDRRKHLKTAPIADLLETIHEGHRYP